VPPLEARGFLELDVRVEPTPSTSIPSPSTSPSILGEIPYSTLLEGNMKMTNNLSKIAATLDHARSTATAVAQLDSDLSLDDAYAIQSFNLQERIAAGETYVGPKLGFTSRSKMEQMGVSDVIVGFLTKEMEHDSK